MIAAARALDLTTPAGLGAFVAVAGLTAVAALLAGHGVFARFAAWWRAGPHYVWPLEEPQAPPSLHRIGLAVDLPAPDPAVVEALHSILDSKARALWPRIEWSFDPNPQPGALTGAAAAAYFDRLVAEGRVVEAYEPRHVHVRRRGPRPYDWTTETPWDDPIADPLASMRAWGR